MYEHKTQPLLSRKLFFVRLLKHFVLSFLLFFVSLAIGVLGYRIFEGLPWLDALLNASMILGGMGPVNQLTTVSGKLFASFYALFSGIIFLAGAGIIVAPIAHRIMHRLQLQGEEAERSL
jgi:hypothetical protein